MIAAGPADVNRTGCRGCPTDRCLGLLDERSRGGRFPRSRGLDVGAAGADGIDFGSKPRAGRGAADPGGPGVGSGRCWAGPLLAEFRPLVLERVSDPQPGGGFSRNGPTVRWLRALVRARPRRLCGENCWAASKRSQRDLLNRTTTSRPCRIGGVIDNASVTDQLKQEVL